MFNDKHKAQMIVLTAFLCGIIAGAAGQYLFRQKTLSPPAASATETLDEMTRAIKLTPQQRTEVEQILDDTKRQYQELRDRTKPQYNEIRDAARERIRSLLPADQQALYQEWTRRQDAKRATKPAHNGK
jgi:uncharacterized membrane protein